MKKKHLYRKNTQKLKHSEIDEKIVKTQLVIHKKGGDRLTNSKN